MPHHQELTLALVGFVALLGLAFTLQPLSFGPLFYIDYPEIVEGCAGGWLYSQSQVEGKSKYVNYPATTRSLHCYDYYSTIKRLGTPASEKPTAGRCYKEKCCWLEQPLERVKYPPLQRSFFQKLKDYFSYSPVAQYIRNETILEIPWKCK